MHRAMVGADMGADGAIEHGEIGPDEDVVDRDANRHKSAGPDGLRAGGRISRTARQD